MRLSFAVALGCLCTLSLAAADPAKASIRKDTDIPAESLGAALQTLATTYDFQVLYRTEIVKDLKTKGVSGSLSSKEALGQVLNGTGLSYKYLDEKTVTVFSVPDAAGTANAPLSPVASHSAGDGTQEGKKSASGSFRLAQVDQGKSSGDVSVVKDGDSNSPQGSTGLTEIVVSAEKRSERLQDVPIPVTALSAQTLLNNNQVRIQDYYTSVPGLSFTPNVQSQQSLSIRGVTTGGNTNPTVGVTVDDVPYGASTAQAGGLVVPDIDPGDLARVEVLRGPQGTLYGASSMGGLLKFVTVDPSTDAVTGRVQAGTSSVYNGAELGYSFRGSINVPLSDTFAIRASAFTREDPGYIDDPVLGIDGVNEARVSGGRLSALWKESELLSVKFSALYQVTTTHGNDDVDIEPGLKDLQQDYLPGTGGYRREVQAYSATVTSKIGIVDLTAISGFNGNSFSDSDDFSSEFGGLGNAVYGVPGSPLLTNNRTSKFTQEIRLSAPLGQHLDWLFGVFYTHEKSNYQQNIEAENPDYVIIADALSLSIPITYAEYAAFTDVTIHVTDRFDIQVGARESEIRQSSAQVESGPYAPILTGKPSPAIYPAVDSSNSAFTYLLTPRFRLSPDLMLYARLASGYRAGGPNLSPGGVTPAEYNPDKTQDYEIGIKGDFFERTLTVDGSVYYIDWRNIQLQAVNPLTDLTYGFNGNTAKSQGVELSVQSNPLTGLTIGGWVSSDEAVLTEDLPATAPGYGLSGTRLPNTPRFSSNVSAQQSFPLWNDVSGFVGGSVSYIGLREGILGTKTAPARQDFPGYARTDLSAGAKYQSWTANLYANNVTDRRGVLQGGIGAFPTFGFTYIQPRTVGLNVTREF